MLQPLHAFLFRLYTNLKPNWYFREVNEFQFFDVMQYFGEMLIEFRLEMGLKTYNLHRIQLLY